MNAEEYDEYRETIDDRSQAALDAGDIEAFVKIQVCHWGFVLPENEDSLKSDTSFREFWAPHAQLNFGWTSKMMMIVGFSCYGYEIDLSEQEAMSLDTIQEIVDLLKKEESSISV